MTKDILCVSAIIIIILEICGFSFSIRNRGIKIVAYYTQISNFITLLSAIIMLNYLSNGIIPTWVKQMRFLSSCLLLITALVTVFILVPMGAPPRYVLFSGNGLFHHTLVPIISILSYLYLEPHVKSKDAIYDPLVITIIYAAVMVPMNILRKFDGPYPFLKVHKQSILASILWFVVMFTIVTTLSWALFTISIKL